MQFLAHNKSHFLYKFNDLFFLHSFFFEQILKFVIQYQVSTIDFLCVTFNYMSWIVKQDNHYSVLFPNKASL